MTTALAIDQQNRDLLFNYKSFGNGAYAKKVEKYISSEKAHFFISVTNSKSYQLREKLTAAISEALLDNWDGYNSSRVKNKAIKVAEKFIDLYPLSIPLPDIGVEPDGCIEFEWFLDSSRLFILSLDENGILSYAGRFGEGTKIHGKEILLNEIPEEIIGKLIRLFRKT